MENYVLFRNNSQKHRELPAAGGPPVVFRGRKGPDKNFIRSINRPFSSAGWRNYVLPRAVPPGPSGCTAWVVVGWAADVGCSPVPVRYRIGPAGRLVRLLVALNRSIPPEGDVSLRGGDGAGS